MLPRYVEECRQTKPKTLWETDNAHTINTYLISQILNTEAVSHCIVEIGSGDSRRKYVPINRNIVSSHT